MATGEPEGLKPAGEIVKIFKTSSPNSVDISKVGGWQAGIRLLDSLVYNAKGLSRINKPDSLTHEFVKVLLANGGKAKSSDDRPSTVDPMNVTSPVSLGDLKGVFDNMTKEYEKYIAERGTPTLADKLGDTKRQLEQQPKKSSMSGLIPAQQPLKPGEFMSLGGSRKSRKLGSKFSRCVKSVRKTVKARPKSSKESAAIAICTKSVLHTRGRTMKRYRKGRLTTQKKH